MKIIKLVLILITFVLNSQSFAQKKLNKLTNYNGRDYWIVEKNGFKGLKPNKGKAVVPANYDLALPSLLPEISFIAKDGNIGLYDNLNQREIVWESNLPAMFVTTNRSGELEVVFTDNDYNNPKEIWYTLTEDENQEITANKQTTIDYSSYYLNNGLERIDSLNYIHHFSKVVKLEGEENYNIVDLEKTVQKTGVYSLALNDFVVAPAYKSFEKLGEYDEYENYVNTDFYNAIQLDKSSYTNNEEDYKPTKLFKDLFRIAVYSPDFKLLLAPQTQYIAPVNNGGFYTKCQTGSLLIYNSEGDLAFDIKSFPNEFYSIYLYGSFCYLKTENMSEVEHGFNMFTFYMYNKEGSLINTEHLQIHFSNDSNNIVVVSTPDPAFEGDLFFGFYDFGKNEFFIPPTYSIITKHFYRKDIVTCAPNNCSYYFELKNGNEVSYLDQHYKTFTPKRAIEKNVFEQLYLVDSWFDEEVYLEVEPTNEHDPDYKLYTKTDIPITYKIKGSDLNEYEAEPLDFYGFVSEEFKELEIVAMYSFGDRNPDEQRAYGLKYKNESYFLLPPFFSKMEFDKENNKLYFTYKEESGSILLERYEN